MASLLGNAVIAALVAAGVHASAPAAAQATQAGHVAGAAAGGLKPAQTFRRAVAVTSPARLAVEARRVRCRGGVRIHLFVDGRARGTARVASRRYRRYLSTATVTPGRHIVTIKVTTGPTLRCRDPLAFRRVVPLPVAAPHQRLPAPPAPPPGAAPVPRGSAPGAAAPAVRLGAAVSWPLLEQAGWYRDLLAANFDSLTPENVMKMDVVAPTPDTFDFSSSDRLVDWAAANGKTIHGHTLVWADQLPSWLATGTFTRDQLLAILERHVKTVVGRYRGRIATWDVVNEPLNGDGSLRPSIWSQGIGPEYIELALRWAHEADPGAKLLINDYNVDRPLPKTDAMIALLRDLRSRGVPVDGVGLQMHFTATWFPTQAEMAATMQRYAGLGLGVQVTELDVAASGFPGTRDEQLDAQAQVYGAAARACRDTPACTSVTTWGFSDASTWLGSSEFPLPFDAAGQAKPAWTALTSTLR